MPARPWWQTSVFYQVYPRSFQDSNGDGVGDLRGIASRLVYLAGLGIDAVWISPFYPSPMADFGYDVSDFENVDPLFGTLDDFDHLLAEAHQRGLRIIMDFVPNHTSSAHRWFQESRTSRDNPKRDWYIWADPKPDGGAPNNWLSYFGGPAWTFDPATGQYYLHNFDPTQPDLNWRNPAVKQAMFDSMRFWLRRGVDGFRVDVIAVMLKDPALRDNPVDPGWKEGDHPGFRVRRVYSEQAAGIHDLIAEMRAVVVEFPNRMLVGEIPYTTDPALQVSFFGTPDKPEVQQPFNFALLELPWNGPAIRGFVAAYDAAVPSFGWPVYVLGNHDRDRLVSRLGAQARAAALFLLTVRGAPYIYNGEELGMPNGEVAPEQYQDPQGINVGISRDLCRTPFHWTGDAKAGFTTGTPWLPVGSTAGTLNVETESADPHSFLSLYRALLAVRRAHPALHAGTMTLLDTPETTLAFVREDGGERFLSAINFTGEAQTLALPPLGAATVVVSSALDREGPVDLSALALRPNEGLLIRLE